MGKVTKKLMQPAYFNQGQPEGYTRTQCVNCNATGTRGGSKCPTCAGYGAYYHMEVEESTGRREITTAARRIAREVNEDYGKYYVIFFDYAGRRVNSRVGPGDPWPTDYHWRILPTKMGPQPQRWTQREVQDSMEEQDREREQGNG